MGISSTIRSTKNTEVLIGTAFLALANMLFHFMPTAVFVVVLLAVQLLFVDKKDNAVVFIALGIVVGAIFATQGVRFVGVFLMLIGFFWVVKDFWTAQKKLFPSLLIIGVTLLYFYISVKMTTGGTFAESKLRATSTSAFLYLLAYGHIALYPNKHNGTHLGFLFVCYSIVMMMYMNELAGSSGLLSSLFRLGGFRSGFEEYKIGLDEDDFSFNYQTI